MSDDGAGRVLAAALLQAIVDTEAPDTKVLDARLSGDKSKILNGATALKSLPNDHDAVVLSRSLDRQALSNRELRGTL